LSLAYHDLLLAIDFSGPVNCPDVPGILKELLLLLQLQDMSEEERSAILHDSLNRHYRDLLDQPIPILGNKSPKTLENHAAKSAGRNGEIANYSFNWIWTKLGVAELKRDENSRRS
jgi:hypothetical protein